MLTPYFVLLLFSFVVMISINLFYTTPDNDVKALSSDYPIVINISPIRYYPHYIMLILSIKCIYDALIGTHYSELFFILPLIYLSLIAVFIKPYKLTLSADHLELRHQFSIKTYPITSINKIEIKQEVTKDDIINRVVLQLKNGNNVVISNDFAVSITTISQLLINAHKQYRDISEEAIQPQDDKNIATININNDAIENVPNYANHNELTEFSSGLKLVIQIICYLLPINIVVIFICRDIPKAFDVLALPIIFISIAVLIFALFINKKITLYPNYLTLTNSLGLKREVYYKNIQFITHVESDKKSDDVIFLSLKDGEKVRLMCANFGIKDASILKEAIQYKIDKEH